MRDTLPRNDQSDAKPSTTLWTTTVIVDNSYCQHARKALKEAKSEVRICAYAWRWYENEPEIEIQKLNVDLLRLQRRGVVVRCLVDTEAMAKTFTTLGFKARSVVNTRMLHTKAISIDSSSLLLGSHNLTKRANSDNYEMSMMTTEFQAIDAFNEYFDKLWLSRG